MVAGMKSIRAPRRYPCGKRKSRLEQIADAEQATRDAAILTVLSQPHRRGQRSQLAENPLGRFCLTHGLDRALYDAAEAYGNLRQKWRAYSGAQDAEGMGPRYGSRWGLYRAPWRGGFDIREARADCED
jgi:hypothetical protein